MSLKYRPLIVAICVAELLWNSFIVAICMYGLGKVYYKWIMTMGSEYGKFEVDVEQLVVFILGSVIPVCGLPFTVGLFLVAFLNGRCHVLVLLYCLKNTVMFSLEVAFMGRLINRYNRDEMDYDNFIFSFTVNACFGLVFPFIFTAVAWTFHLWIKRRDRVALFLVTKYDELVKVKAAGKPKKGETKKKARAKGKRAALPHPVKNSHQPAKKKKRTKDQPDKTEHPRSNHEAPEADPNEKVSNPAVEKADQQPTAVIDNADENPNL